VSFDRREPARLPGDAAAPRSGDAEPLAAPPAEPSAEAPSRGRRARGCLFEIIETVVLTLVIFVLLQNFVAQPFQVQQRSMETTFIEGDYVLVDRLSHLWAPYQRGQVIVFQPPASWEEEGGKPFIKRIIAVGGDTIVIRDDGKVAVNDVVIEEPYLFKGDDGEAEPTESLNGTSRWTIPTGELFVMGDHREMSADSRLFDSIPVSSVIGRGILRYWPASKFGLVEGATYDNLPAP
jgi:signal peptidase I